MSKHHRLILLAGFITGLAALGLTAAGRQYGLLHRLLPA